MNKLYRVIFAIFLFINNAKSQETFDYNSIVIINEQIEPGTVSISLKYISKDGIEKKIQTNYVPGSLKINKEYIEAFKKDSIQDFNIEIQYVSIVKGSVKYTFFVIDDLNFSLFESYFFILRIYDTTLKKYHKIYNPINNKNFTYEFDSGLGSMTRVRKE